jgi:curved DNA-binding protein CbpA
METIRRAWLIRIRNTHPDRHAGAAEEVRQEMALRSAELNAAWSLLSDGDRRLDYDLETGQRPARCSGCGEPGSLRKGPAGSVVAACGRCYVPQTHRSRFV